jgi:hypothetical protein
MLGGLPQVLVSERLVVKRERNQPTAGFQNLFEFQKPFPWIEQILQDMVTNYDVDFTQAAKSAGNFDPWGDGTSRIKEDFSSRLQLKNIGAILPFASQQSVRGMNKGLKSPRTVS